MTAGNGGLRSALTVALDKKKPRHGAAFIGIDKLGERLRLASPDLRDATSDLRGATPGGSPEDRLISA